MKKTFLDFPDLDLLKNMLLIALLIPRVETRDERHPSNASYAHHGVVFWRDGCHDDCKDCAHVIMSKLRRETHFSGDKDGGSGDDNDEL